MTVEPSAFEISLLPDPERAAIANAYRLLGDENRRLYAETGSALFRDLAEYAHRRADDAERGVSLLFDAEV